MNLKTNELMGLTSGISFFTLCVIIWLWFAKKKY